MHVYNMKYLKLVRMFFMNINIFGMLSEFFVISHKFFQHQSECFFPKFTFDIIILFLFYYCLFEKHERLYILKFFSNSVLVSSTKNMIKTALN